MVSLTNDFVDVVLVVIHLPASALPAVVGRERKLLDSPEFAGGN